MIPFYIITCDKTSSILKASSYLLNKYWKGYNFTVLGNNPVDLPENFTFVKIKNDDNPRHWTKDLYEFFKNTKDEYFILSLDDFFFNREADNNKLDNLLSYTKDHKVGRIQLIDFQEGYYELLGISNESNTKLLRLKQDAIYRLSCQVSIRDRDYLLKYFNHNWTPWDLELRGSKHAMNDGWEIIGSYSSVMGSNIEGALSSKWPGKVNIRGLKDEDLEYLLKENILKKEDLFCYKP